VWRPVYCVLVLALSFAGCTSMITTEHLDDRKTPMRDGAIGYALPMTLLKLSVVELTVGNRKRYEIAPFNEGQSCKNDSNRLCSEILTVADPRHAYVVKYRGNVLFDDDLTLGVNEQGFLTGATGKATDHTGDIIVGIARIAQGDFPQPKLYGIDDRPVEKETILIDPHDPQFMNYANERLRRYGMQVECGECRTSALPVRGEA
jgi:hypothetical protein